LLRLLILYCSFRSNTLSFALFERLFLFNSSSDGTIGFLHAFPFETLPHVQTGKSGGQMHGRSFLQKAFFTIRSSSEWNVITHSLPPSANRLIMSSRLFSSTSS